jgi:membrane-bound ClpP family serine protease
MTQNRFTFKLLFMSAVSLLGDAIILTIAIIILSRFGIRTPIWLIIPIAILFIGWTFISYLTMTRNPRIGFENMIGTTGLTLDSLSPKGTVRIGHEQWAAKARDGNIETGVTVVVVGQNGLWLTVVRKDQTESTDHSAS